MEKNNRKMDPGGKRDNFTNREKKEEEEERALPSERCENLTSIKQEGNTNNYRSKRTWKFKIWV